MVSRSRSPRSTGLGISEGLRRRAEWLMDQEMWCLGRDIRHPEGNALIRAGFHVWRPLTNVVGGNGYTWTLPDGGRLTLWGFGLCYAREPSTGLLYLGRFLFRPTWRPEAELPVDVWDTTRLPRFQTPRNEQEWEKTRLLTAGALTALAIYEEWAEATLGRVHRQTTIDSWFKTRCDAGRIAPSWRSLARRLGQVVA